MKEKFKRLRKCLQIAIRKNPIEVLLAMFFCVLGCYMFETENLSWKSVLTHAPILFMITYILNGLTTEKRRSFYYLSALLFLPVYFWEKEPVSISLMVSLVMVLLIYLASRWEKDNDSFMQVGLRYVGACLSACLLAFIIWGLSISVYYSIHYIFEIGDGWWENRFITYAASFAYLGIMPLLFLMFNQEKEGELEGNSVFDVLINFVLSPALLIYAVILYLYFIKGAVLWSLPKGGVAYIVISFISAIFLLKGCQAFVSKRYYDWFYPWSSWIVLPALVMYWVGVCYRINQYGFTEARVYLVVIGLILTGMDFLFFSKWTGRYLYVALLAIVLLSSVTYIPGMTAKDIERISQIRRGTYPIASAQDFSERSMVIANDREEIDIERYHFLSEVQTYQTKKSMYLFYDQDSTVLYTSRQEILLAEQTDSLFYRQLRKVGLTPSDSIPESAYPDLLKVELYTGTLLLDRLSIYYSRDSIWHVSWISPWLYLNSKED